LAGFFALYSVCALVCVEWTEMRRRNVVKKTTL
jgi:hypothetical protein